MIMLCHLPVLPLYIILVFILLIKMSFEEHMFLFSWFISYCWLGTFCFAPLYQFSFGCPFWVWYCRLYLPHFQLPLFKKCKLSKLTSVFRHKKWIFQTPPGSICNNIAPLFMDLSLFHATQQQLLVCLH